MFHQLKHRFIYILAQRLRLSTVPLSMGFDRKEGTRSDRRTTPRFGPPQTKSPPTYACQCLLMREQRTQTRLLGVQAAW